MTKIDFSNKITLIKYTRALGYLLGKLYVREGLSWYAYPHRHDGRTPEQYKIYGVGLKDAKEYVERLTRETSSTST